MGEQEWTRPSLGLLALEAPRAIGELGWFQTFRPLLDRAPRGDGHPVLVLPGLTAGDRSTGPMRGFLRRIGYHVHGWRLGTNMGPTPETVAGLRQRFADLREKHPDETISIVGWSLGGIYAREIAKAMPDAVRQVITLGSPFRDLPGHESHPAAFWRMTGRTPLRVVGDGPLTVPFTAVYTRSDGVVAWRTSVAEAGPRAESVEVRGSHAGLGHNPAVLWVIADRLAQPPGRWSPFRPTGPWSALYPRRSQS